MRPKNVFLFTAISLILVVSAFAVSQSSMLQGSFQALHPRVSPTIYQYQGQYVTAVASPVTSVVVSEVTSEVVSEVTSQVGTSKVTSKVPSKVTSEVPSTITSPVASAVVVKARIAERLQNTEVKALTKAILIQAAQDDFKANPSKYILTSGQRQRILDLYTRSIQ